MTGAQEKNKAGGGAQGAEEQMGSERLGDWVTVAQQ